MSVVPAYPKIYSLGHAAVDSLLDVPVRVEEKIDGSQFSFGFLDGQLKMRSKGAVVHTDNAPDLFVPAAETAQTLYLRGLLKEGWVYRGEALCRPKHNSLKYDRAPEEGFILFDVDDGRGHYMDADERAEEASRLRLEVVPVLYEGMISSEDQLRKLMDAESFLGGPKMEGVVIKPVTPYFGIDGKAVMGKWVSEEFKEVHRVEWNKSNKSPSDIISTVIDAMKTEARWLKAVYRFRDDGTLHGDPRDIGPLMGEVARDVLEEEEENIKEILWKWSKKRIGRGVTAGLPQWYKDRLLASQFEGAA